MAGLADALVVSLSRNFWDDVWRSRHQVMSRLARANTVLFASRPLKVDEARSWEGRSPLRRSGIHKVSDTLFAYVPPRYLPTVGRVPVLERQLARWRRAHLRRVAGRWAGRPSVLYLWHPSFEPYIELFPESVLCYHLFDDLAHYGEKRDVQVEAALGRIFRRADLVFVSSEELLDRYRAFGNVHCVPNGVDYQAFAGEAPHVPSDLAEIPGPRLGYTGTLRAQIDIDMLAAIAQARPDWSLVLIGDVSRATAASDAFERLRGLPNVYFLGSKGVADVPAYVRHLDAGLLPYRVDGAARYCYPLKMHEYLAAGLPVVSSPLAAVRPFSSVIRTAETLDEWVARIQDGLAARARELVDARRHVAQQNSWDERVNMISALLSDALHRRQRAQAGVSRARAVRAS